MKKILKLIFILIISFVLIGCEQNIQSKCNHQWDDGTIIKIEGKAYKKYTCIICESIKQEDMGLPIIVDKYLVEVVAGQEYLYEFLDIAYESGKFVNIKLFPNNTINYNVKINDVKIEATEYKDLYILYEFEMPNEDVKVSITTDSIKRIFNGTFPLIPIAVNPNELFTQRQPLEINYNSMLLDDGSELLIYNKIVDENFFKFLDNYKIVMESYSRIFEKLKTQTNIYIANQDIENIPCYQGSYYNVYYFVIVEGKTYYIPVVQNIDNGEIISSAVYLLADDPHRSSGLSDCNYFTLKKVEEGSNKIYLIKSYKEFEDFNNKFYNYLEDNASYSVYKFKYDESYFNNNYLIVSFIDETNKDNYSVIYSSMTSSSVLSYTYRIKTQGTIKEESTLFTIIEKSNINLDKLERVLINYPSKQIIYNVNKE